MVNGDPTTFMFTVKLKFTKPDGSSFIKYSYIGASNYEEAKENAVNCWKRWEKNCKIEVA